MSIDTRTISTQSIVRNSNLELYRIICMLMIVAHHFVVNSGLTSADGPLTINPISENSIFLRIYGMWGKTGINCFLMITGYYMCTRKITLRKFVKLLSQIYLYKFMFFGVFLFLGYEHISLRRLIILLSPFWELKDNFINCFIAFYLLIPFLNILIQNMSEKQHKYLLFLLLFYYTICGSIPSFVITFNYITWFCIIYIIASYIRLYPKTLFNKNNYVRLLTISSILLAIASVIVLLYTKPLVYPWLFVIDSNKVLAVLVAVASFIYFKNLNLKHSKIINAIGGSTFGVLLIHANSDAMLRWLWKDTLDVVGHYPLPLIQLILYSIGVVILVFVVCNILDQIRVHLFEKPFFRWYDTKFK